MAETNSDKMFESKVLPIMDKVMQDLQSKQVAETKNHLNSFSFLIAAMAGPDGGIAAQQSKVDTLQYTGEWNSKHTEDYVKMVKDELERQKITVTPEIEGMMIDKMIKDKIPKSSIEYIMKKAASNTLFYLPQALNMSPLENHITTQAEKMYDPSTLEKGTGYVIGAAADYLTLGGVGGTWATAAKYVGVDVAVNAALESVSPDDSESIPLVVDPNYMEQYKKEQMEEAANKGLDAKPADTKTKTEEMQEERADSHQSHEVASATPSNAEQTAVQSEQTNAYDWRAATAKLVGADVAVNTALESVSSDDTEYVPLVIDPNYMEQYKKEQKEAANKVLSVQTAETDAMPEEIQGSHEAVSATPSIAEQAAVQPEQTNAYGWNGLLTSFGLNGLGDIGSNLGYILAMLPDVLVGTFTGKTNSLGLKNNLMPLASIVAGMFVKNPLLKMVLIGMGAINIVNKAGHEALDMQKANGMNQKISETARTNYKVYEDEPLNRRISQPQIKGNCLLATIDKVPCTIALPSKVIDAYCQGALPLNTLANAVLAKNDQMRQMASENYAASEQQNQTRTLAHR